MKDKFTVDFIASNSKGWVADAHFKVKELREINSLLLDWIDTISKDNDNLWATLRIEIDKD